MNNISSSALKLDRIWYHFHSMLPWLETVTDGIRATHERRALHLFLTANMTSFCGLHIISSIVYIQLLIFNTCQINVIVTTQKKFWINDVYKICIFQYKIQYNSVEDEWDTFIAHVSDMIRLKYISKFLHLTPILYSSLWHDII